jgi:hypothetical protein
MDFDTGIGVGKLRECRQTMDCTPTEECGSSRDCRQTEECRACVVRNIFTGGCSVWGNDPVCEARKVANKGACEADKAAEKGRCEAAKSSRKLACEADKEAKRIDCERLKTTQIVSAKVYEAAIHESIKSARATTLKSIPSSIESQLKGYFKPELLDRVRYTTRWSDWASVQKYALEWNGMAAITFDYIIVFKQEDDANENVRLWAHELEHVKQYQKFGIDGFAQMYMHKESTMEGNARKQENYVCSTLGC